MSDHHRWLSAILLAGAFQSAPLGAQVLTLEEARTRALARSPLLAGSREEIAAATAWARQAGAFSNPVLSYAREQTSRGGGSNWQNIGLIEQRLDFSGARSARRDAAGQRQLAALARGQVVEAEVLYLVTRAYVEAVALDRQAARMGQLADAFARARRISAERRAEGDVSGYADRRVALEAARYAALHAEALLARHRARLTLGTLLASDADAITPLELSLEDSLALLPVGLPLDSLRLLALEVRGDLRAAGAEAAASVAEARAARREAFPIPTAAIGFKNEQAAADPGASNGIVLQLSFPVALWDGRRGAALAYQAEGRRQRAESDRLRREISHEVESAWAGMSTARHELDALGPQLGREAELALTAAETAYQEGEISLVEWLDAVRAYQEAESSFTSLQADYLVQRAALERAVGTRLQ